MRDNTFLRNCFLELYRQHFADVALPNKIVVGFGRYSKTRLGSIKLNEKKQSVITLTGYFRSEEVPLAVLEATLAHEFIHYLHGFNSLHTRKVQHPHRGNVVKEEMRERGLLPILVAQQRWLRTRWNSFVGNTAKWD